VELLRLGDFFAYHLDMIYLAGNIAHGLAAFSHQVRTTLA
jgi:hypothetical protein